MRKTPRKYPPPPLQTMAEFLAKTYPPPKRQTYTEFMARCKALNPPKNPHRALVPRFLNPISNHKKFFEIIGKLKFSLESVTVSEPSSELMTLTGVVRVLNLAPNMQILVRYSFNKFDDYFDVVATLLEGPFVFSKQFGFSIYVDSMKIGDELQFVVIFRGPDGFKYWDTNDLKFFIIDCEDALRPKKKFAVKYHSK